MVDPTKLGPPEQSTQLPPAADTTSTERIEQQAKTKDVADEPLATIHFQSGNPPQGQRRTSVVIPAGSGSHETVITEEIAKQSPVLAEVFSGQVQEQPATKTKESSPQPKTTRQATPKTDFQALKNAARKKQMSEIQGKPEDKQLFTKLNEVEETYQLALQKADGHPTGIKRAEEARKKGINKIKAEAQKDSKQAIRTLKKDYNTAIKLADSPEELSGVKHAYKKELARLKTQVKGVTSKIYMHAATSAQRELNLLSHDRDQFLDDVKRRILAKQLSPENLKAMQSEYWNKYKAAYRHLSNANFELSARAAGSWRHPQKALKNWKATSQIKMHNITGRVPLPNVKGKDTAAFIGKNAQFKSDKAQEKMNLALDVYLLSSSLFTTPDEMEKSWERPGLARFLVSELSAAQDNLVSEHNQLIERYEVVQPDSDAAKEIQFKLQENGEKLTAMKKRISPLLDFVEKQNSSEIIAPRSIWAKDATSYSLQQGVDPAAGLVELQKKLDDHQAKPTGILNRPEWEKTRLEMESSLKNGRKYDSLYKEEILIRRAKSINNWTEAALAENKPITTIDKVYESDPKRAPRHTTKILESLNK